jgi:hypothetical protein
MSAEKFITALRSPEMTRKDISYQPTRSRARMYLILHDYMHGINSDPLTLFAIVFSASDSIPTRVILTMSSCAKRDGSSLQEQEVRRAELF